MVPDTGNPADSRSGNSQSHRIRSGDPIGRVLPAIEPAGTVHGSLPLMSGAGHSLPPRLEVGRKFRSVAVGAARIIGARVGARRTINALPHRDFHGEEVGLGLISEHRRLLLHAQQSRIGARHGLGNPSQGNGNV